MGAVLLAGSGEQPRVLTRECSHALPAGPFESSHRSLQAALRAWVEAQTHHPIGYVEQLYTFADGDRANWQGQRIISVSYLGLTRESENLDIDRSEERRVGKECVSTCRSRWSPVP